VGVKGRAVLGWTRVGSRNVDDGCAQVRKRKDGVRAFFACPVATTFFLPILRESRLSSSTSSSSAPMRRHPRTSGRRGTPRVQATLAMPPSSSPQQQQQQQQQKQRYLNQQQMQRSKGDVQLTGKQIEETAMLKCISTAASVPVAAPAGGLLDPRTLRWQGSSLEAAYERCGAVCSEYAKTFFLGTQLMTPIQAKCIWAIYVWCRRTDELVDGPNASKITPQVRECRQRGGRRQRLRF